MDVSRHVKYYVIVRGRTIHTTEESFLLVVKQIKCCGIQLRATNIRCKVLEVRVAICLVGIGSDLANVYKNLFLFDYP